MKETFIQECVSILKQSEIKNEIKHLFTPVVEIILNDIYPYIFLSIFYILVSFCLNVAIFVQLLRINKQKE